MSDYTQITDFSAKDTLTTGNPNKKIIGSEYDTEFSAISTAIASKKDAAIRGCKVYLSADQTISTATETALAFTTENYDTDSIHSNSSNTSRLTVPSGVTYIRLTGQVAWNAAGTSGYRHARIYKNGSLFHGHGYSRTIYSGSYAYATNNIESPVLAVTAGDYFELKVMHSEGSDAAVDGNASTAITWFAMEILQ